MPRASVDDYKVLVSFKKNWKLKKGRDIDQNITFITQKDWVRGYSLLWEPWQSR